MNKVLIPLLMILVINNYIWSQELSDRSRARDIGVEVGVMLPGKMNAITDVPGVLVGHKTIIRGDSVRTGVTAIIPFSGNVFQDKVPAAIEVFNGFGKLAGYSQVKELGNIETPVILTNTLNVGTAVNAVIKYTLGLEGNEQVRSVNAVVGETNDGYLNDIRGQHITEQDVLDAIKNAKEGPVKEGSVGAGTGTTALGFKGGIGTSSRIVSMHNEQIYTIGVLVQSNFGRELIINGTPFKRRNVGQDINKSGGSCMIIIATDAPMSERNLSRLASRSFIGMGRTTTSTTNDSGDYAIAFSTAYTISHTKNYVSIPSPGLIGNDLMSVFFRAVEEATQEAIYNSLFMATSVSGIDGHKAEAIPLEEVKELIREGNPTMQ